MNNKSGLQKVCSLLADLLFPKFCLNCGREGTYLCPDCRALIDVLEHRYCLCEQPRLTLDGKCKNCRDKSLDGLYFAVPPSDKLLQKLLHEYRVNLVKDLAGPLASLIITHFHLLNNPQPRADKELVVVPTARTEVKEKGFDPTLKIAEVLSERLKIPLLEETLQPNFEVAKPVEGKELFLFDFVYRGEDMERWARVLKQHRAEQVWGLTATRKA